MQYLNPWSSTGPAVGPLLKKVRPNGRAAKAVTQATRSDRKASGKLCRGLFPRRIREFPLASAAVALGTGLLIGALLSPRKWFGRNERTGIF